jgi:hypothetical protein
VGEEHFLARHLPIALSSFSCATSFCSSKKKEKLQVAYFQPFPLPEEDTPKAWPWNLSSSLYL